MATRIVVYNVAMGAIDLIVARVLMRRRAVVAALASLVIIAFTSIVLAWTMTFDMFRALVLLSWGVFLHGLVGLALIAAFVVRRRTALIALAFCAVVLQAIAADAFLIEPTWLEVRTVRVTSAKVVAPLRIGVVADVDTRNVGEYERRTLRVLMAAHPDLILFAGDYFPPDDYDKFLRLADRYRGLLIRENVTARLGAFAVQGNVDEGDWQRSFRGSAVVADRIGPVSSDRFTLSLLSSEQSFRTDLRVDPRDGFHIVVGHSPNFALGDVQADLLIAGHTHGGQVRLPFIGPLVTLSKVPRAWADGVTHLSGGRTLVVSRGVGLEQADAPHIRFLCRPEITIIEVVPQRS